MLAERQRLSGFPHGGATVAGLHYIVTLYMTHYTSLLNRQASPSLDSAGNTA
jgi:hypothetical protein